MELAIQVPGDWISFFRSRSIVLRSTFHDDSYWEFENWKLYSSTSVLFNSIYVPNDNDKNCFARFLFHIAFLTLRWEGTHNLEMPLQNISNSTSGGHLNVRVCVCVFLGDIHKWEDVVCLRNTINIKSKWNRLFSGLALRSISRDDGIKGTANTNAKLNSVAE